MTLPNLRTFALLLTVALLTGAGVRAQTGAPAASAGAQSRLESALTAFTGVPIQIDSMQPAPIAGLVEVQIANGPMLYASEDGQYFFLQGNLHTLRDGQVVDLTEEKRSVERRALVDQVALNDMIVFTPEGETRDHITVFTDVSCGYCQKLHREVEQLNDYGIEVRYLAWPRGGVDSEGARQLETAWCSDNPRETLTKLKNGVQVPMISCDSERIAEQFALGGRLGVRGTPAIITSDGRMVPGYQPAANLAAMLGLD